MHVAALLAVPVALVGLSVPAYAEDPGLTITWPAVTNVAVPHTAYTITVADEAADPQGTLYAEWQGDRQELPHTGDYTMDFAKGGTGTITIVRCVPPAEPPGDPVCTDTGDVSPVLDVWKVAAADVTGVNDRYQPGNRTATLDLEQVPTTSVQVTWRVQQETTVVESGSAAVTVDAEGVGEFTYPVPQSEGEYFLRADVAFDLPPFGPHRASPHDSIFYADATPPRPSLALSTSTFYPAPDGYRDGVTARFATNEEVDVDLSVYNAAGKLVRKLRGGSLIDGLSETTVWHGRDANGRVVPAGRYQLRFTATDLVGHPTTVTKSVTVSSKRLVKKTWKRTFKAGATLTRNGAFVQACSTLRKPSLRPWAGSLGYYSRTKCNRNNADIVSTTNGIYVPKAFQNKYGSYQVSFYGGGARGTRGAYIVMGYLNNKNAFTHRIQGGAAVRSYAGKVASAGNFVHDKSTRPYVLWTAGLTDGSRYDVKSFTVKLTYTVLA